MNRNSLYDDVISLYEQKGTVSQYPMFVKYAGEKALDTGGVFRDMVSAFWEEAYQKLFDSSTLLALAMDPHLDMPSVLPVVGRVLSHGYLCTGFLLMRLAYPCLAAMLLGPEVDISTQRLVEPFIDYLSEVDREVLQWNLVSSNTQGNPKKVPLKECSTYPKCYNIIHKMAIIMLQQCYVYVSAKLRCVLWCKKLTSVAFVLLLFELPFGLTLPLSKPLT